MAGGQFCHRRKGTDSSVDLSVVRVDGNVRTGGLARRRRAIDSCSNTVQRAEKERGEERRRKEKNRRRRKEKEEQKCSLNLQGSFRV